MENSTLTLPVTDENNTDSDYPVNAKMHFTIAAGFAIVLCLIGLAGNIIVFWYLSFKIKKNKYTTYIINLSAADFIFLLFSIIVLIMYIYTLSNSDPYFKGKESLYTFLEIFSDSTQYSGMFILTAISLERCLSVLFPIWYQCHRPENLSTIVCVLVWLLGCAEGLIDNLVCTPEAFFSQTTECTAVQIMTFGLSVVICLPIMVVSSFTLLIKIKRTVRQQYPQKLYIIIIAAVFIFIISVIPINFVWFLMYFQLLKSDLEIVGFYFASVFCLVLNCTIDPYIYFIVGKKWKQKTNHSIQDALQRAFRIEDDENDDSHSNKTSKASNQTNLANSF
ncbi:mas-related G-protein coupled receptor member D-like [Anomaloglossus baeobatrachus]|uniref:mas-related G-protein coupled receptor member D-like n=1 Tax=Anomaloglossus baeobatrachus TaxID=238106 RepID=UPI003F4F4E07